MSRFLNYLFNIRSGEWPRLVFLYTIGLIFLIGMTWGETVAEASFLHQVGVEFLPLIFVADAVVSIIAIAIYTAFVDRVPNDKLLIALMTICALTIIVGRFLITLNMLTIAYPLLYLLSRVIRDVFNLHWWTYVNDFYDTRAAKRIVPVLATGARIAGIFAGLSLPLLIQILLPNNVMIVWASALWFVAAGAWLMPRVIKNRAEEDERLQATLPAAQGTTYIRNIREGYRYVAQSGFLRWMALSTLLLMVLFTLMTYQTSQILLTQLKSVEGMSNFLAYLTAVTNIIMLPIQLFLLGRIVGWIGMGNANLIFPAGTLAVGAALVAFPSNILAAAAAYFDRTTFRTAFRNTIDNLLYNAVPLRVKGRARAFIGGLIIPISSLIGGAGLIFLNRFSLFSWTIPALIGALTIAYALSTLVIRKQYKRALVEMLEQEDFTFLLAPASTLTVSDTSTLNWLKKRIEESTSSDMTIFMAKLVSEVGGDEAVPTLIQVARDGDPQVRASVTDILVAADLRRDEVRQLFTDFLTDPDGQVRQSAIAGLKQWSNQDSEQFLTLAFELARDPELDVRMQIIPALIRSGDFFYMAAGIQTLEPILTEKGSYWRARGVQALGQVDDVRFIRNLLEYLTDPDDTVRIEAAAAIERLSKDSLPEAIGKLLLDRMSTLLRDPVERVRQAALTILGRINNIEAHQTLVVFLTDPSQEIRGAAVEALVHIGKPVISAIMPGLESSDLQLRKMSSVVLSRIQKDQSSELLRSYIQNNLVAIYDNNIRVEALSNCSRYESIAILLSALRERNQQLIEEIFYLLSAIHNSKTVNVIAESLNSESGRVRANAIEALESLTTPQIARLMSPIFDRELTPAQLLDVSKNNSAVKFDAAEVLRQLASDPNDAWMRTIVTFALGELRAGTYQDQVKRSTIEIAATKAIQLKTEEFGDPENAKARRTKAADILDALASAGEQKPAPPPPAPLPTTDNTVLSPCQALFTNDQIDSMFERASVDPADDVQRAVMAARRMMAGLTIMDMLQQVQEGIMLSAMEKIIFLKKVPFFEEMTIDQLKVLANVCEEELFHEDGLIFQEGEPGGALYVVVRGRVAIEREGARKGSTARLATFEAYSYFGEMTLFDNSPRSGNAIAVQDTLVLKLRREPLLALTRQYPDLSLKLINVLSQRLRDANDRIAQLTTTKPRELHKLYDKLE
ncbi:MAG: sister chromatid cohesion protein PDS5 [Chloroflexota bacterium]